MSARGFEPPVMLRMLLLATAGDAQADLVAGDLHEEFILLCAQLGRRAGNRWYAGQVLRSLPELLRLRMRSGELTQIVVTMACAAAPLLLLDRLWRLIYSTIPLKDGLERAPGFLAANGAVVCLAMLLAGGMVGSRRGAVAMAIAAAAGTGIGIWASVGAAPLMYTGILLLAAPASSVAGYGKWRDK